MNCKKIFIIFLIFITICISIKCIINKCRKPLVETEICIGNTCLEKKDLDRLLLYINKNNYSEKYEDPTPTQNNMLCIGGTCIKESDLNRMLFKSLEPNAISPTVIYSKTPLVRNTEGKDLSTPADIKRMLPNGGVIYSEEIGPITFKINSENEAFYTYPEKIQLWRSVYIVSVDLVYQSFDKSVGDALLRFNDTGNEMGNYYGLRYMETNDKWLELDPIGATSYIRFKSYDGLPVISGNFFTLFQKYYQKRVFIYSPSTSNINDIPISTTPSKCGPGFGKCANTGECCSNEGNCTTPSRFGCGGQQDFPMYNNNTNLIKNYDMNVNVEYNVNGLWLKGVTKGGSPDGSKYTIFNDNPSLNAIVSVENIRHIAPIPCGRDYGKGRCPVGFCCNGSTCIQSTTACYNGTENDFYSNPPKANFIINMHGTVNNPTIFLDNNIWNLFNSEKICAGLLLFKPSKLKKFFESKNLQRIFGYSDDFDYYINDIKYRTPSTNLWIAFITSDGNIYEGLYIPKNFRYNSDDLKDPLSLLSSVRRKANFIDDTWIYENIPSTYISPTNIINGSFLTWEQLRNFKDISSTYKSNDII